MNPLPAITLRHLAGLPQGRLLVVGPSLGTTVDRLWGPVAERLPGCNVIGWDLPGHGHSPGVDRLTPGFSLADLALAVLAALDDAIGPGVRFGYAGDSVGGAVGLELALAQPDRVSHLAVLCSAARFGTSEAWQERAALVRREGMAPMVKTSPARWFGPAITAAEDGRVPPLLADLAAVEPEGYARVCEALAGYDVRERLGEVQPPVLAVAGADDVATPPAALREIVDGVPDGRLEIIDGTGHLAPYEDPTTTADLLRTFLG